MLEGRTAARWAMSAVAALTLGCASAPSSVVLAPRGPVRPQPPPEPVAAAPELAVQSPPVATQAQAAPPAPVEPPAAPPVPVETFTEPQTAPAIIDTFLSLSPAADDLPPPSPATAQAVVEELGTREFDIPIPQNDRVLSYVELFSGRLKGYLEEGLGRGSRYLPMVRSVFQEEGVPLDLAYVPLIESAFKPTALSRAKARGIWQFMHGTGLENGLQADWYLDERADPEKATRAAARYLKFLYEKFGDWHLALASYNGGWGRVQRAMKRSGKTDFWELSASRRYLPRETRDYVPLILAAVVVARNPAQYGLIVQPLPAPQIEVVTIAGPTDLRRVAEWAGTSLEVLQDLNPELRRWTTPPRGDEYPLRVPVGTADAVRLQSVGAAVELPDPFGRHQVRKGETLASIAKRLKVTRTDLAEANYLSVRAKLVAGQSLIIPRPPALLDLTGAPAEVLAVAAEAEGDAPAPVERVAARRAAVPAPPDRRVHRVKQGDTLSSIARRYGTTVTSLREWNKLRGSTIRIGQRLTILRGAGSQAD